MTHVITAACIGRKDQSCIEVCPVDCIHEADEMLVIDPDECIDCGVCIPECPVEAIYPDRDVPAEHAAFTDINALIREGAGSVDEALQAYLSQPGTL
jgi:ferredoxin